MLESVAATILIAAFEFAMIAMVASVPSTLIVWLFRLQSKIYCRAIAGHLEAGGLAYAAAQLLSNGHALTPKALPRWTLNLQLRLDASFDNPEVMTDTVDSQDNLARKNIKTQLLALVPRLERRFELALLGVCCASGVLLCLLTQYSVLDSLSNARWTLFADGRTTADWRTWFGQLVTGLGCGALVFAFVLRRLEPRAGADVVPARPRTSAPTAAAEKRGCGEFSQ